MRRAIVAGTATVSGVILLLGLKSHGSGLQGASQNFSIGSAAGPAASASASSKPASSAPASSAPAKPAGPVSSSTKAVTGDAADTPYGPVQLQITVTGKRITQINVLQYPTETNRDQEINGYALPQLNQEAISAQSANIDVISGATFTSQGYQQSLQSAIDKAGI